MLVLAFVLAQLNMWCTNIERVCMRAYIYVSVYAGLHVYVTYTGLFYYTSLSYLHSLLLRLQSPFPNLLSILRSSYTIYFSLPFMFSLPLPSFISSFCSFVFPTYELPTSPLLFIYPRYTPLFIFLVVYVIYLFILLPLTFVRLFLCPLSYLCYIFVFSLLH